MTSYVDKENRSILELNNFKTKNSVNFSIVDNLKSSQIIDTINSLKKNKDIIITHLYGMQFEPGTMGEGIYFNGDYKNQYNLLEGRFFNKTDFQSNKKIAVIGKGVLDKTHVKNGKRYILSGADEYEVIGVVGKKNISTRYDILVIYNLNLELNNKDIIKYNNWTLDSLNLEEKKLQNMLCNINEEYKSVRILLKYKEGQFNPLESALKNTDFLIYNYLLIIGCVFFSLVRSIYFWLDNIRLEIGIKKLLGATDRDLLLDILQRYVIIFLISILIAIGIQKILMYFQILGCEDFLVTFKNIGIVILFQVIISLFFITISMIKVNRITPSNILKGN
jgi:putative ABC transport system permease protein